MKILWIEFKHWFLRHTCRDIYDGSIRVTFCDKCQLVTDVSAWDDINKTWL